MMFALECPVGPFLKEGAIFFFLQVSDLLYGVITKMRIIGLKNVIQAIADITMVPDISAIFKFKTIVMAVKQTGINTVTSGHRA
jgi:hypothetical protein